MTAASGKFESSMEVVRAFHTVLNSASAVPEHAFRRNSTAYPLVCYVNNITGLFLSESFDPIPIFVARAIEHMAEFPPHTERLKRYHQLVTSYLTHTAYHLTNFVAGAVFDSDRVPAVVLHGGCQQVPSWAQR
mgnify:FL=1